MAASETGNLDVVQALLAGGAKVNESDVMGSTALMKASEKGHLTVVRALINKSADVNAKNSGGKAALDLATGEDVKALLRRASAKP